MFMEPSVRLSVCAKLLTSSINLSSVFQISLQAFRVIVRVNEVISRVVGRVYIDHFNFTKVGLLQKLEDFEIVAFNDQIFGRVEVHAFFRAWSKGADARLLDSLEAVRLPRPDYPEAFLPNIDTFAESELQTLEIDLPAFRADLGEQSQQLRLPVFGDIVGPEV